jgi:hypothetical protein
VRADGSQRRAFEVWKGQLSEAACDRADEQSWCSDFDEFMGAWGLQGRVRDFDVEVHVSGRVSVTTPGSGFRPCRAAMQDALYGQDGFFLRPTQGQHFRTSVTASPVFAQAVRWLAGPVDDALGRPDPFDVVDVGAGGGQLLSALPDVPARWRLTGVDLGPDPGTGVRWAAAVPPLPDGSCDLTAHVALDSCITAVGGRLVRQREALLSLGIDDTLPPPELSLTDPQGYLTRLQAASRATELLDPRGLGGFAGSSVRSVGSSGPSPGPTGSARCRAVVSRRRVTRTASTPAAAAGAAMPHLGSRPDRASRGSRPPRDWRRLRPPASGH